MKIKNKLSDLVELECLKADQEGMLRGGFAMLEERPCKHNGVNGNCNCNTNSNGCMGNDNCSCNSKCDHNCDCNCNCVVTTPPTEDTTEASGKAVMSMKLFMF